MNKTDDGVTPFLVHTEPPKGTQLVFNQVSLRDYFAAAALSSMDATRELNFLEPGKENSQMAQRAYRIADAMLKARKAKP